MKEAIGMDLYNFKNYIFDCDGVILDSNRVKTNIFMESVRCFDQKNQNEFKSYLLENGGVTRDKKYRYFFENILEISDQEEVERLVLLHVEKFAKQVFVELCEASFTNGILKFLKELSLRNKDVYIWTGGRRSETVEVMKERGVLSLFKGIYGAPGSKRETLELLINENEIDLSSSLVIGDSLTDQSCASEKRIKFLFVTGYTSTAMKSLNTVKDFDFNNLEIF